VRLRSLLHAALPISLPRSLRLVALLMLRLPAVRLTSRKKSLLPAVPPAVPATSNRGFPPKSVPGGKVLAGNLVNHSVIPIYIHIPEDKVMMI
jgi:hypothetical protein